MAVLKTVAGPGGPQSVEMSDDEAAAFSASRIVTLTPDDVWAEKDRRWSLGFTYTFPDDRGAHVIGTTPKDLQDWQKVGELANAAVQLGQPDTPIGIFTNTGPVTIKASEWWNIVIATAMFQQPIFQGAVALVAMDPIPADYATNDAYWTTSS